MGTNSRTYKLGIFLVGLALIGPALAGCGGGGSSAPPIASTAALQNGKAKLTFRIDVPQSSTSSLKRKPQYISPSTTQLAIDIEQGGVPVSGYPVTVALTPTSSGCSSTLSNTVCQLTVTLALGSYTATLTAEDANGTPLSSAQDIAFTVSSTSSNVVAITLSGIPSALQIASGAIAVHGSGTSGFKLYGSAPEPLIVNALDADGNVIVGLGSPTYSATLVSGSGWSAATPSSTMPNTIAITPPGINGAGATFSVTATYPDTTCSLPGAVCSATFAIKNDIQTLFVANYGGTTVTAYAPPYTGTPVTINGNQNPFSLALDAGEDLFVGNANSTVTEFAAPYTALTATISVSDGTQILLGATGNLFVASYDNSNVSEFTPPYTGAPTVISNATNESQCERLDSSANLFVGNLGNNTVTEYAPPYTGAPALTITTGVNGPNALALDAAGDLFVANANGNTVTEYVPPYTGAPATTISTGLNYPFRLAFDGFGDLFVANRSGNTVTEYTPPYTGTPTTISNGVQAPYALTIDGSGNLFVANNTADTVTEYAPPYTGTPTTITTGLNGPFDLLLTP